MPTAVSFELFGQTVRDATVRVGERFTEPDDDWRGVMQLENVDHEGMILMLDGSLFVPESEDGGAAKDGLVDALMAAMREFKTARFSLLLNTWLLSTEDDPTADAWHGAIHEHPMRKEVLVLTIVDSDHEEVWMADIIRPGDKPPTLAPWRNITKEGTYTGRWMQLREALVEG